MSARYCETAADRRARARCLARLRLAMAPPRPVRVPCSFCGGEARNGAEVYPASGETLVMCRSCEEGDDA